MVFKSKQAIALAQTRARKAEIRAARLAAAASAPPAASEEELEADEENGDREQQAAAAAEEAGESPSSSSDDGGEEETTYTSAASDENDELDELDELDEVDEFGEVDGTDETAASAEDTGLSKLVQEPVTSSSDPRRRHPRPPHPPPPPPRRLPSTSPPSSHRSPDASGSEGDSEAQDMPLIEFSPILPARLHEGRRPQLQQLQQSERAAAAALSSSAPPTRFASDTKPAVSDRLHRATSAAGAASDTAAGTHADSCLLLPLTPLTATPAAVGQTGRGAAHAAAAANAEVPTLSSSGLLPHLSTPLLHRERGAVESPPPLILLTPPPASTIGRHEAPSTSSPLSPESLRLQHAASLFEHAAAAHATAADAATAAAAELNLACAMKRSHTGRAAREEMMEEEVRSARIPSSVMPQQPGETAASLFTPSTAMQLQLSSAADPWDDTAAGATAAPSRSCLARLRTTAAHAEYAGAPTRDEQMSEGMIGSDIPPLPSSSSLLDGCPSLSLFSSLHLTGQQSVLDMYQHSTAHGLLPAAAAAAVEQVPVCSSSLNDSAILPAAPLLPSLSQQQQPAAAPGRNE